MLSYAFSVLREQGYRRMATEDFENTAGLCAAILARGFEIQMKRGLERNYIEKTDTLPTIRGKMDISDSLKSQAYMRRQMVCTYDEFSVDTPAHRIIKSTFKLLLRSNISKSRKKDIRALMSYLSEVSPINLRDAEWNLRFDRNNQTYRMLVSVCYLVAKGLLQTQSDGSLKMADFLDERRMHALYEKFVLEYYRREHPELDASASQIPWALDDGITEMLPIMQSDIMLSHGEKTLIIDAKYYDHSLQSHYGAQKLHSGNLYQIFTYVKNKDAELAVLGVPHEVSGMLLYAKTDEEILPEGDYVMSGNRISVATLDLDQDFSLIRESLDSIARNHFFPLGEEEQRDLIKAF